MIKVDTGPTQWTFYTTYRTRGIYWFSDKVDPEGAMKLAKEKIEEARCEIDKSFARITDGSEPPPEPH
jgi:hypothetical protein